MGKRIDYLKNLMRSRRGKNLITFLIFLAISTVLWAIQSLSEEVQSDIRCKIEITHVPDSLTRITPLPEAINVSVRAGGTQLIHYFWVKEPKMVIDFRQYKLRNTISFSEAALKSYFRNMIGSGAQVLSVTPDSLSIQYTSNKGIELPVKVDAHITTGPQYVLVGQPKSLTDSVKLYSLHGNLSRIKSVSTADIVLSHITKSQVVRVPLIAPKNCRAIPDSVDVSITVEPLISKTRNVRITTINVPYGVKLIPEPTSVDVYYMVPMSTYKRNQLDAKFVVEADYHNAKASKNGKIPLRLASVPKGLTNVFLATDSVEFLIEQ